MHGHGDDTITADGTVRVETLPVVQCLLDAHLYQNALLPFVAGFSPPERRVFLQRLIETASFELGGRLVRNTIMAELYDLRHQGAEARRFLLPDFYLKSPFPVFDLAPLGGQGTDPIFNRPERLQAHILKFLRQQGRTVPDIVWRPRKASFMGFNDLVTHWDPDQVRLVAYEEVDTKTAERIRAYGSQRLADGVIDWLVDAEIVAEFGVAPTQLSLARNISRKNRRASDTAVSRTALEALRRRWEADPDTDADLYVSVHPRARGDARIVFSGYPLWQIFNGYDQERGITAEQRHEVNEKGRLFGCVIHRCENSRERMAERGIDPGYWFPCGNLPQLSSENGRPEHTRYLCARHFYSFEFLDDKKNCIGATLNVTRVVLEHPEELAVIHRWGHCHANNCPNVGVPVPLRPDPFAVFPFVCTMCYWRRDNQLPEIEALGKQALAKGRFAGVFQKDYLVDCCVEGCPNPAVAGDIGHQCTVLSRFGYHCRDGSACRSCWSTRYGGIPRAQDVLAKYGSPSKPKPGVIIKTNLLNGAVLDLYATSASTEGALEALIIEKSIHLAIHLYPVPISVTFAKALLRNKIRNEKIAQTGTWLRHLREDAATWVQDVAAAAADDSAGDED